MSIPESQGNHLAKEKSPYLLEHAKNPVDWFPWSDEAFELAKKEQKMIFVSIGYSACHWCHVMRRESFENKKIADILNRNFVSIKVDREERPDIDHLLQLTFQIMNGRGGGWPLSIFMTPDKKPFYAGTYYPLQSKWGMPGFEDVLHAIINAYKNKLNDITVQADKVSDYIKQLQLKDQLFETYEVNYTEITEFFAEIFDSTYGGFGNAPKFPTETGLSLLLHASAISGSSTGLNMLFKTLISMLEGGIYDQLGGGFHRYSVDEEWLVPHFEKMLYNQSLLVLVLVEAFRVSKNNLYLDKAKEILTYVSREMISPTGGFFSSQNADSDGTEGKFFVWAKDELSFLDKTSLDIICDHYGITDRGNWEGKNVLHINMSIENLGLKFKKKPEEIKEIIDKVKKQMVAIRNSRIKPSKDTKVITSWNALMTKAYLAVSRITLEESKRKQFLMIAKANIDHILSMVDKDIIYRISVDGKKSVAGFLDDYQYTISMLLDYYEISLEEMYLTLASKLYEFTLRTFYDTEHGGFYYSLDSHDTIITRFKDTFDSPLPSPVSFAIQNALRLEFFGSIKSESIESVIKQTISQVNLKNNRDYISQASFIYSVDLYNSHFTEITIIEKSTKKDNLLSLNQLWIPFRLQINASTEIQAAKNIEKEFLKGKKLINDESTIYICKNFVCSKPLNFKEQIIEYLQKLYPNTRFS